MPIKSRKYKVEEVHEDVKDKKQILAKTQRLARLPSSDAVVQQIPLKPAVFHGRDVIIEKITQLLMEKHLTSVFSAQVGWELHTSATDVFLSRTSVALGVVQQLLIKALFLPENIF